MTLSGDVMDMRPSMDPRIWQRRVEVTRANGRRRLRLLLAAAAVCMLAAGAFGALHSSLFAAKHFTVTGAVHTPVEEVLASAGLLGHPPLVDLNTARAAARIEALPWVASASVVAHWPDSVTVSVTERTPVVAIVPAGETPVDGPWTLVDSTGRVLGVATSMPQSLVSLTVPIASGSPGTELPITDQPGIEVASSIPESLAGRVDSVAVSSGGEVTLGLSGGLSAELGSAVDLPAKYESLATVLAGAPLEPGEVIDVSDPSEPTVGTQVATN